MAVPKREGIQSQREGENACRSGQRGLKLPDSQRLPGTKGRGWGSVSEIGVIEFVGRHSVSGGHGEL